jgi:CheY-like chemotaxis protein
MLVIEESVLPELRKTPLTATLPSLLILCHQPVDYALAQTEWLALATSVDIIRRPCGPHKLARSVLKCFRNSRSTVVTPASVLSNPMDSIDFVYRSPPITSAINSTFMSPVSVSSSAAFDELSLTVAAGSSLKSIGESPTDIPSVVPELSEVIAASAPPAPLVEDTISSSRLARVLVVDDNRINLNLMMTFMKKRNLTDLASAENGKLAVEAVERMEMGFDIIFMDISMPVMNGFEATRAIRAREKENENRRPAVIIALTGLSSSRDESEALSSGVDMFLTKPVSFREVSRLLAEWEANGLEKERNIACKFD